MIEVLTMATIIAPVTAALVQAIKTSKIVKRKFLPLISVLIGIGIGASATFLDTELMIRIWAGGISGLAATGLFELSKKV
ncbi:holin [Oceanobacillus luteolus]|uniref:Holin n=1 Tax=Oceanobacillus luteolus TaxID=1274358 RepID=A0ABW4HP63_9BACI|nr:holin [Oceanobacillus luteolus]MCM3741875.1 holin [Oceanobacillus luteolus]